MNMPNIRFTWDLNIGAVLQIVTVISVAAGLYALGLRFQWETEAGIQRADEARLKYVPIVEQLVKSDDIQNFRLESMGSAVLELRKLTIDSNQKLNEVAQDTAVIKKTLELEGRKKEQN